MTDNKKISVDFDVWDLSIRAFKPLDQDNPMPTSAAENSDMTTVNNCITVITSIDDNLQTVINQNKTMIGQIIGVAS